MQLPLEEEVFTKTSQFDELKDLVSKTLEKKGILAKAQAQLRKHVFEALADEEQKKYPSNDISEELLKDDYDKFALALIRDFLTFHHLDFTLSLMNTESRKKLEKSESLTRNEIASKLGLGAQKPIPSNSLLKQLVIKLFTKDVLQPRNSILDENTKLKPRPSNNLYRSSIDSNFSGLTIDSSLYENQNENKNELQTKKEENSVKMEDNFSQLSDLNTNKKIKQLPSLALNKDNKNIKDNKNNNKKDEIHSNVSSSLSSAISSNQNQNQTEVNTEIDIDIELGSDSNHSNHSNDGTETEIDITVSEPAKDDLKYLSTKKSNSSDIEDEEIEEAESVLTEIVSDSTAEINNHKNITTKSLDKKDNKDVTKTNDTDLEELTFSTLSSLNGLPPLNKKKNNASNKLSPIHINSSKKKSIDTKSNADSHLSSTVDEALNELLESDKESDKESIIEEEEEEVNDLYDEDDEDSVSKLESSMDATLEQLKKNNTELKQQTKEFEKVKKAASIATESEIYEDDFGSEEIEESEELNDEVSDISVQSGADNPYAAKV